MKDNTNNETVVTADSFFNEPNSDNIEIVEMDDVKRSTEHLPTLADLMKEPEDIVEENTNESNEEDIKESNELEVEEGVEEPAPASDNTVGSEDDSELITPFFEAFAEELGWDVDDEDKPKDIPGLIKYMQDVIEENSTPEFANDEIAQLNEYVKAGGSVADYMKITSPFDIENADLETKMGQKRIVEEHLRDLGWNADKIRRAINRYEDSNTLAEEAEDALESLKEITAAEKEKLIQEQKEYQKAELARQEAFYNTVATNVKDVEYIRGVPVNKQDKAKLMDYIFTVGADGQTAYARDYNKNIHQSLIESAFFTMKGDTFMKTAEAKAKTSATAKLREQLRTQAKGKSSVNVREGKTDVKSFFGIN